MWKDGHQKITKVAKSPGRLIYIEAALVHYLQFWFFGRNWDRWTEKTILKLKKEIARRFLVNEELKRRYNEDASWP